MEGIPIKEYSKELQDTYAEHGGHNHLQRHELLDIQKELAVLQEVVRTLLEDTKATIEQKETHCGRCGEEFHELNEESSESEGYCSYCESLGQ